MTNRIKNERIDNTQNILRTESLSGIACGSVNTHHDHSFYPCRHVIRKLCTELSAAVNPNENNPHCIDKNSLIEYQYTFVFRPTHKIEIPFEDKEAGKLPNLTIPAHCLMKSAVFRIFCLTVLCLFFLPLSGTAQEDTEANISDIIITTSKTHLLMFCTIKNSFTPAMIEGVRNGIPITFDFFIELDKVKNNWPDSTLTEQKIRHTLTYDPLREEYQVDLPEKGKNKITTPSIDKAMQNMAELNGLKIIELDKLTPDSLYALHVKAKMAEKRLPLNMHYIIPFISLWDFETAWRVIEFRY